MFVFNLPSIFAQTILDNPTENFQESLSSFHLRKITFDEIDNNFGYLHHDVVKILSDNRSQTQLDELNFHDSFNECLFICHPEMYFYYRSGLDFLEDVEK